MSHSLYRVKTVLASRQVLCLVSIQRPWIHHFNRNRNNNRSKDKFSVAKAALEIPISVREAFKKEKSVDFWVGPNPHKCGKNLHLFSYSVSLSVIKNPQPFSVKHLTFREDFKNKSHQTCGNFHMWLDHGENIRKKIKVFCLKFFVHDFWIHLLQFFG